MSLKILGDLHAGKKFVNDVPLHRRGEREKEIISRLHKSLNEVERHDEHIQVGDLFDQFKVSNEDLWEVFAAYHDSASLNPEVNYVLYPGNHDLSRDADKVSSFQLLKIMLADVPNIKFVTEVCVYNGHGFLPWHPFKSAAELAQELVDLGIKDLDMVFCHCDLESFGGEGQNVIPIQLLSGITKKIITGHVHTPQTFKAHGVEIIVTGSADPYSHGEDPDHTRYLTLTPDELASYDLQDKYIRLKIKRGTEPPAVPNCMGWKIIYEDEPETITPESLAVEFKEFSTRGLFLATLDKVGVSPETQQKVLEKFDVHIS